ncbi:MAG TPA: DNA mismatch repair endonuclease MutL [Candidatus Angelobacter sp.]|jgi:DNA mismatch repair protein MutL|nr:DNA mismatch repair endonuclease MutL [Candidatus Angelobacter sp.]
MSAAPPRIHLLAPQIADAIAAGEVVERPASVVKELCENALDAGAARVEVDVDGGGMVRIRVSDDGAGIAATDMPLAIARHATSKIAQVDDLWRVRSLGFRGEALASIAAVSELCITSRTRDADAASLLRVRAAELVEQGSAAAAPGTSVEVRDLFFNTPARLRFLRTPRTETSVCIRAVGDMALSHPEVSFTCRCDGRTVLRAPGGGSLRDALRATLRADRYAELIDVAGDGEVSVHGAISQPRMHQATRGGMVLIVNRRRVHNRALLAAVEESYRGLLPGDRHPFGVVVVELDPNGVDVNVHPTKREVRFREEGRVFSSVQRACWAALRGAAPASAFLQWDANLGGVPAAFLTVREQRADGGGTALRLPGTEVEWRGLTAAGEGSHGLAVESHAFGSRAEVTGGDGTDGADDTGTGISADGIGLAALRPLRAIGQVGSAWLVAESPRGVVLVDPHAAHEKVLYGELLAEWGSAGGVAGRGGEGGASQLLLLPAVVECDERQVARFEAHADFVQRCGFTLEPFGPNLLRCTAVPAAARDSDTARLVHELLDTLDLGDRPASERQHRVAALVACHSAVRFGDPLDPSEQQRLLDLLVAAPGGVTCPHGRPTVVVLEDAALRRAFRRP